MYRARFLKTFLRQEKKLNANTKERLIKAVKEILNSPYSGLNLKGDLREYWKKRVGKYRIIYKISESEKIVIFFDVNLRKKVYNRLKRR
jgi:mRNA interferase RelE/StbE